MSRIALTLLLACPTVGLVFGCGPSEAEKRAAAEQAEQSRREQFQVKLKAGREALEAQRYGEAIDSLEAAVQLDPNDQTAPALLGQARSAKREADYVRAMKDGRSAFDAGDYEKATAAFSEAERTKPGDKEAGERRGEAEFPWRMQQGRVAMAAQRYADAVSAYERAVHLRPKDTESARLLESARDARRKQVQDEYDQAMNKGRNYLGNKNYASAMDAFATAQRLKPGDEQAAELAKEAEFHLNFERGSAAVQAKNPAAALAALERARQLRPNDQPTRALLDQAQAEQRKQTRAEYDRAIASGKAALSGNRYDDAIREFQKAKTLLPSETEAGRLLSEAESKKREFNKKIEAEQLAKKKRDFDALVSRGRSLMSSGNYDGAIAAFREADRLGVGSTFSLISDAERQKRDAEMKKREAEMKKKK